MTDEQLEEIYLHKTGYESCTQLDIAAMRTAVQLGIDEHEANKRGYIFDHWLIEQQKKILEAVEKGSIEFNEWISRNDIDCAGVIDDERYWHYKDAAITSKQLYREYQEYLKSINEIVEKKH